MSDTTANSLEAIGKKLYAQARQQRAMDDAEDAAQARIAADRVDGSEEARENLRILAGQMTLLASYIRGEHRND